MTEPEWERVRELFLELAERTDAERERELGVVARQDAALAERVRVLLRHDRESALDVPVARAMRFGPYEAIRRIGEGGMGEVWIARRADGEYDREVAVKLLRAGTASRELVERFLRERQALARLDHEYIARLLDGGTTDTGEPYLVMEYVDGEPADVVAARLELDGRLELFVSICKAVAHAHERGFVHRDLKPSNILVRADGTPRLLDFGIARPDPERASDDREGRERALTRTGHRLFTPEYASPEQVTGDEVTTKSDVFALGVILYEFLCGASPWPRTERIVDLETSIREHDPAPPSRRLRGTGRGRVAGDLDAIALQCLAKRPGQRYASVEELCADVQRHRAGVPILARRTGAFGRAVRLARRKPAVPLVALLLVSIAIAAVVAWNAERRAERRRAELASSVAGRIEAARTLFADGEDEDAEVEIDAALATLVDLPGETALEFDALVQKAIFANMRRDWDAARALLERARPSLDALEATPEQADPDAAARYYNSYAYLLQSTAPGPGSLDAAEVALEHARARLQPGEILYADALLAWADELRRDGRDEDALAILEEAVRETRARDPKLEELNRLLNELAVALARAGRLEEAIAAYEEALEVLAWHRGERHPSFPKIRLNLGTAYFRQQRYDEAIEQYELTRSGAEREGLVLHGAVAQYYLGRIASRRGDQEAARAAGREALAACEAIGSEPHANRARGLLGIADARSGRMDDAHAMLDPLLASDALPEDLAEEARAALAGE